MPVFMNNNNYIAWLYIRGIPEYIARARTILHLSYGRVQYGPSLGNIIQILTATVMKYHVAVDCQELYFPKGLYFPEARSAEGKYNHKGKYNYLGTTDT